MVTQETHRRALVALRHTGYGSLPVASHSSGPEQMSRAYNFSPGPAGLPDAVLQRARDEMLEWDGAGASIVELSHRGPEFIAVAAKAEADLRALLSVPDDYAVLFLAGGATTQQALIALNFATPGQKTDYVLSGHWGKTAIRQVAHCVDVHVAASGEG